jgi:hypothetical protein
MPTTDAPSNFQLPIAHLHQEASDEDEKDAIGAGQSPMANRHSANLPAARVNLPLSEARC